MKERNKMMIKKVHKRDDSHHTMLARIKKMREDIEEVEEMLEECMGDENDDYRDDDYDDDDDTGYNRRGRVTTHNRRVRR